MAGYDSAQIANLVGLYILDTLSRIVDPIQLGLYHNDGILYITNSDGSKCSSTQKKIIRTFKFFGFKMEISSNIKVANFLDVTLNLFDNSYRPFLKTDEYPPYIYVNSNHPNSIIKQLPKAVNTRISRLSSNKKLFHESSRMCIEALKNSGIKEVCTYLEPKMPNNIINNNKLDMNKENTNCNDKVNCRKNRKRKITWFNPTFCKLENINIGKIF